MFVRSFENFKNLIKVEIYIHGLHMLIAIQNIGFSLSCKYFLLY